MSSWNINKPMESGAKSEINRDQWETDSLDMADDDVLECVMEIIQSQVSLGAYYKCRQALLNPTEANLKGALAQIVDALDGPESFSEPAYQALDRMHTIMYEQMNKLRMLRRRARCLSASPVPSEQRLREAYERAAAQKFKLERTDVNGADNHALDDDELAWQTCPEIGFDQGQPHPDEAGADEGARGLPDSRDLAASRRQLEECAKYDDPATSQGAVRRPQDSRLRSAPPAIEHLLRESRSRMPAPVLTAATASAQDRGLRTYDAHSGTERTMRDSESRTAARIRSAEHHTREFRLHDAPPASEPWMRGPAQHGDIDDMDYEQPIDLRVRKPLNLLGTYPARKNRGRNNIINQKKVRTLSFAPKPVHGSAKLLEYDDEVVESRVVGHCPPSTCLLSAPPDSEHLRHETASYAPAFVTQKTVFSRRDLHQRNLSNSALLKNEPAIREFESYMHGPMSSVERHVQEFSARGAPPEGEYRPRTYAPCAMLHAPSTAATPLQTTTSEGPISHDYRTNNAEHLIKSENASYNYTDCPIRNPLNPLRSSGYKEEEISRYDDNRAVRFTTDSMRSNMESRPLEHEQNLSNLYIRRGSGYLPNRNADSASYSESRVRGLGAARSKGNMSLYYALTRLPSYDGVVDTLPRLCNVIRIILKKYGVEVERYIILALSCKLKGRTTIACLCRAFQHESVGRLLSELAMQHGTVYRANSILSDISESVNEIDCSENTTDNSPPKISVVPTSAMIKMKAKDPSNCSDGNEVSQFSIRKNNKYIEESQVPITILKQKEQSQYYANAAETSASFAFDYSNMSSAVSTQLKIKNQVEYKIGIKDINTFVSMESDLSNRFDNAAFAASEINYLRLAIAIYTVRQVVAPASLESLHSASNSYLDQVNVGYILDPGISLLSYGNTFDFMDNLIV